MSAPYQSPDITGHEVEIKTVLHNFLVEASAHPNFVADRAVHDATVYVMAHLPAGVDRVDGYVIEPLLREVVESAITANAPEPAKTGFVSTLKNFWRKLWR